MIMEISFSVNFNVNKRINAVSPRKPQISLISIKTTHSNDHCRKQEVFHLFQGNLKNALVLMKEKALNFWIKRIEVHGS